MKINKVNITIIFSISFIFLILIGCNQYNNNPESTSDIKLSPESKKIIENIWIDSSYCISDFKISTPLPLDYEERKLPNEAEKIIESNNYFILQTKDNLLIQLICTNYKTNSLKSFDFESTHDRLIKTTLENAFKTSVTYDKKNVHFKDYEGYFVNGQYLDQNEIISIKMAVFFKELSLWQLLIVYNADIKEQNQIAENVFRSIK